MNNLYVHLLSEWWRQKAKLDEALEYQSTMHMVLWKILAAHLLFVAIAIFTLIIINVETSLRIGNCALATRYITLMAE